MAFKSKKAKPSKVILSSTPVQKLDFELGDDQTQALKELQHFWSEPEQEFYLLKGYAGTGKSTLCSVFIQDLPLNKIRLCATTNKAASVLDAKCRETGLAVQVTTIHKLLKLVPQQIGDQWRLRQMDEPDLHHLDLLIIDECSMISEELWNHLQDLPFKYQLKILCMGDPAQLPPVNENHSPCFDIPFSSELTEIFRQGHDHPILNYSLKIREALNQPQQEIPLPQACEGIQLFKNSKLWLQALKQDFETKQAKSMMDHLQVLSWTNHRVDRWNDWIQDNIYPSEHGPFSQDQYLVLTSPVTKGGWNTPHQIIMPNNETVKVIASKQIKWRTLSLWELDIRSIDGTHAKITYIPPSLRETFEEQCIEWEHESSNKISIRQQVENFKRQCVGIQPASSLTTHRSQGSSFDIVYLDLPSILSCPRRHELLQMLYVAVTRAKFQLNVLLPS